MTTQGYRLKLTRVNALKLRVSSRIPNQLVGGTGIEVTKANGQFDIAVSFGEFGEFGSFDNASESHLYIPFWDDVGDVYSRINITNIKSDIALTFDGLYQPLDATLTALAGLNSTAGLVVETAADTFTKRTLQAGTAIGVTNGDGVSGNPTVAVTDAELLALAGVTSASDKLFYFTGSGTGTLADFTSFGRSLVDDSNAAAARTTLGVVIGTDVQAFDADLSALAANSTDGLWAHTGAGTGAARTLTAPAAGLTITNPAGIAGNPTFSLANDLAALEALTGTNTIFYRSAADTWTPVTIGTNLTFTGGTLSVGGGAGIGDVVGPATNTDLFVPQWNGANTKVLKNGLGVGTSANNLVQLDGSAKLPAVDGSQVTNVGTRVLLNTLTASNSPDLQDITSFTSTFPMYEIVIDRLIAGTNATELKLQVHSGGSFRTTNYLSTGSFTLSNNNTDAAISRTTHICLSEQGTVSNADPGLSATIRVFDPSNSGRTNFKADIIHARDDGGTEFATQGQVGGYWNTAGAVTGFKLSMSSGLIASAVVRIYGLR